MRTFSLVTVTLPAEQLAIPEEAADLEGVIVVTDDPEEMDMGCETGNHNLGFIFLTTIDNADCQISTCMPCTMDDIRQGLITRITPREDRTINTDEEVTA
jgi:hypothetical protein